MTINWRGQWIGYGLSIVIPVAAFLLRWALVRATGELPPWITFYPAVMVVAVLSGLGPGLLATALSVLAAAYWIIPPHGQVLPKSLPDTFSLGLFLIMGVFMSGLAWLYHRAQEQAAKYEKEMVLRESSAIRQSNRVLNAINSIFKEALASDTEEKIGEACLRIAQESTGSGSGFVLVPGPDGSLHNVAGGHHVGELVKPDKTGPLRLSDFSLHSLYGRVLLGGESFYTNDPAPHTDVAGTAREHQAVKSFLGVPLVFSGPAVGMLALADRDGGYRQEELDLLNALAPAIVEAMYRTRAEQKIISLNEELRDNVLQLEAANREIEAFSYSVSHDLRSPLRSVAGFSQVLFEDYADKLDAEGIDSLERILNATRRMGRLIDDLLNLSHVSRAEMRREEVNLSGLAGTVAVALAKTQPERQAEFNIAEDLVVQGDDHLLAIVLENLLGNAWKFTAKTPRAVIEFGVMKEGISPTGLIGPIYFVRDNGAGFDMSYAGKMFNPFQRLHSTDEFPGTGIGLATVKRIINRHGGQVWIEGEINKGTTVYFTL